MVEWDADAELEAAEADWEERRRELKNPIERRTDHSSWQWANIASWVTTLGVPSILIFGNTTIAASVAVIFGALGIVSLSALKPDNCPVCKIYEQKIKLF